MDIAIVSCAHGRAHITAHWAAHLRRLMPHAPANTVTVAVTTGDAANVAAIEAHRWTAIEAPNDPLGDKHNAALSAAPDAAAYMILPSDDFVHPEWIKDSTRAIKKGARYVLPTRCGLWHPETGRTCFLYQVKDGNRAFGAGRVWSHAVREKVGPVFWTPHLQRGLDSDTHRRIRAHGFEPTFLDTAYIPVTDVKSGENLWAYDSALNRRCRACDGEEVLGHLGETTRVELQRARPS